MQAMKQPKICALHCNVHQPSSRSIKRFFVDQPSPMSRPNVHQGSSRLIRSLYLSTLTRFKVCAVGKTTAARFWLRQQAENEEHKTMTFRVSAYACFDTLNAPMILIFCTRREYKPAGYAILENEA
eukprot:1158112-Pelagomonas_calceolata.AAC.4